MRLRGLAFLRDSEPAMASSPPPSTTVIASGSATATPSRGSIGIVVGPLAAVAMLVVATLCFSSHRRRNREAPGVESSQLAPEEISAEYLRGSDDDLHSPFDGVRRCAMDEILDADKTLRAWRVSASDVSDVHPLGQGGHSFVHLVIFRNGTLATSMRLATRRPTAELFAQLVAEVQVVARLQHRCVVHFLGVSWTTALDFQLLYEYVGGVDLRSYLRQTAPQHDGESRWSLDKLEITLDIAEGLLYLHSFFPPIVHSGLQPRRILLTPTGRAKISGLGRGRPDERTRRWLAPEILSGKAHDQRSDIYAFGVLLTDLATHAELVEREPQRIMSWPPEMKPLLERCTAPDPNDRPDALELAFRVRKLCETSGQATHTTHADQV